MEPRIGVLHYSGDVIVGKSCVFLSEATLNVTDKSPLFLRHSDIVPAILTAVKMHPVNDLLCKSLEKNTFAAKDLRVESAQGPASGPG